MVCCVSIENNIAEKKFSIPETQWVQFPLSKLSKSPFTTTMLHQIAANSSHVRIKVAVKMTSVQPQLRSISVVNISARYCCLCFFIPVCEMLNSPFLKMSLLLEKARLFLCIDFTSVEMVAFSVDLLMVDID